MIARMHEPFFSLVILCYKSEEKAVPFVERVHRMLSNCNFAWELVLVGNYLPNSSDRTPQVVAELSERLPHTRFVVFPKKGMMGWDMKMGLDNAKGKYIGIIDGDGQFPIESVLSCLFKLDLEELDFVKTYRVRRDDGLYRRLISSGYNFLFQLLFNAKIRDANSKPKIIRRSAYVAFDLKSDDWFIDAEMMIRAKELNLKVGEVPVHFYANEGRASFVRFQSVFEFAVNLFKYRFCRNSKR